MKRSFPKRRPRKAQRGYALITVVVLVGLMTTAVAMVNEEAIASLSNAGQVRTAEMLKGALDTGLDQAIDQALQRDAVDLAENPYDIFAAPTPISSGFDFIPAFFYPAAGPSTNELQVRIGLRPGQRTRPPSGEDVRKAYGQIVELQVSVQSALPNAPPAEERASVGVLIPRVYSN